MRHVLVLTILTVSGCASVDWDALEELAADTYQAALEQEREEGEAADWSSALDSALVRQGAATAASGSSTSGSATEGYANAVTPGAAPSQAGDGNQLARQLCEEWQKLVKDPYETTEEHISRSRDHLRSWRMDGEAVDEGGFHFYPDQESVTVRSFQIRGAAGVKCSRPIQHGSNVSSRVSVQWSDAGPVVGNGILALSLSTEDARKHDISNGRHWVYVSVSGDLNDRGAPVLKIKRVLIRKGGPSGPTAVEWDGGGHLY